MLIGNKRRRLQREKRDSRDPGLSVAREAARPRPRKASSCSGTSTIKFNRAYTLGKYKLAAKKRIRRSGQF
ncbi:MAG: hypothetical protein ACE3JN_11830 [Ectobacillus sp.]